MSVDLAQIVQLLQASINPQQHRQAEAALREAERQPGFSIALLQITAGDNYPSTSRLAGALCFKNFIKRNWVNEDGNYKLPQNEVVNIKNELVGLMIRVPPAIQSQLGEAISVIADSDFWERWDTLVDDLVSRLTPDNAAVNNGVLQVAHSIFRRWRPLFRSDQLFTEINHVLSKFCRPFLTLLQNTDAAIDAATSQGNKQALQQHVANLSLAFQLFYDLSCQDLPPDFEDNLQSLCALLDKYIKYDNGSLQGGDDAEVGPLETVKAEIFEVLTLYVQKYEDAFGAYIGGFVDSSWNLLTTLGPQTKFDILASRALNFLTSISGIKQHAASFNNDEVLSQIVEKVVLPNIALRESDEELFEDEPIEFTRRDLEGSDTETRRRAATDFLRQLMTQFQERVTAMTTRYIDHFLQEYAQDKSKWKSKDTAVYLFSSIAAVGAVTTSQGVKTTNPYVNIVDFFQKNIAEDLVSNSAHVILQVDAVKFLYIFRSQMPPQTWQEALPLLVRHLESTNYVVHTYCAIAIDRILYLTEGTSQQPLIPRSAVATLSQDLLSKLFTLIMKDHAPEKVQENEFLMRCVMRVLIVLGEDLIPLTDFLLQRLTAVMNVIRHNPSNPRFYYYLFEAMGALIRFAAPAQPEKLETALYQPFANILGEDVQEFMPYVLQLFAALLEANPSGTLSDYYKNLIPPVLMGSLWESKGNTPALTRLLSSLIARGAADIAAANQLEPILGIWQNLIARKTSETYGGDLLEAIISAFPVPTLQPYFVPIFNLLLKRLSDSKTEAFSSRFTRLFHFMCSRSEEGLGPDAVVAVLNQVQDGLFAQVYPAVILPETQKLTRPIDRKIAVISLTKIIADSNVFAEKFAKGWGRTCEALLKIMVNPPVLEAAHHSIPDQDVDDVSFGVGFTQLNTCRRVPLDPYPNITDLKPWISQYLQEANSRHGGRVSKFMQERLSPELQQALVAYMQS